MLEIESCAHYGDVMERALYNGILGAMAKDGKSFFYVNALESNPNESKHDIRKKHVTPIRQKWFGCACCPPNLARLIENIGEYCYTENKNTLFINLYIGADVQSDKGTLEILSDYTQNGKITIHISPKQSFVLALRIPRWCNEPKFSTGEYTIKDGFAYFNVGSESTISAEFTPEIQINHSSNLVKYNIGKVAVSRGALIYCFESTDNNENLHLLRLSENPEFEYKNGVITANGYRQKADEELYSPCVATEEENVKLRFIPFYDRLNRGEAEMSVYIRK